MDILKQSNYLTNAFYSCTGLQKNILYEILTQLQEYTNMDFSKVPKELSFPLDIKKLTPHNNYARVRKAIDDMYNMEVAYWYTNKENKKVLVRTHIFDRQENVEGSSTINLVLKPKSIPLLLDCGFQGLLSGKPIGPGYTTYQRKVAMELQSVFSKRMYEYINSWSDKGGVIAKLEDVKQRLGIENKYKRFADLRKMVLDVAQKELKEKADLYFEYDKKSKDGKIAYLFIKVIKKPEYIKNNKSLDRVRALFTDKESKRILELLENWNVYNVKAIEDILISRKAKFKAWYKENQEKIATGKIRNPGYALMRDFGYINPKKTKK